MGYEPPHGYDFGTGEWNDFREVLWITPEDRGESGSASPAPGLLRPNGNHLRYYWVNSKEAAPFIKFLDDDDYMPPCAVSELMKPMADANCVLSVGRMAVQYAPDDKYARFRVTNGTLARGQFGTGSMLVKTSAARGIPFLMSLNSDLSWIWTVTAKGTVGHTQAVIYFYNAYRTNAGRVNA